MSEKPTYEELERKVHELEKAESECKRIEEDLRDSRNMLQIILDTIPSGVFWKDRDLIYRGCNRTWLAWTGLDSLEEVIGKSDDEFPWSKDETESFREHDRRVMESGVPEYDVVEPYLRADGIQAWAKTNKVPLRDIEDNIIGILGTSEDITEHKRVAEELRKSEEKYKELAESISDVFFALDKNLRYTYWNKASEILTGVPAENAVGKMLTEVMPDNEARKQVEKMFLQVIETKKPAQLIEKYPGNEQIVHEINVYPTTEGVTVFVKDITEHKRLEQEKEKLISDLQISLQKIKKLSGLLPICSYCKKIRDDKGYWNQIESYIHKYSDTEFSHSICPECAEKYYPDFNIYDEDEDELQ